MPTKKKLEGKKTLAELFQGFEPRTAVVSNNIHDKTPSKNMIEVKEKSNLKNLKKELEKKEGKLEKSEKRKKELKSSYNKSLIPTKIKLPFGVSVFLGLASCMFAWVNSADLVSGVIFGIFIGSLIGIFSAAYIIFFDYVNPRRLIKDCRNIKLEIHKNENRIEEYIRETKQKDLMALIIEGNIELNRDNAINAHRIYQNAQKVLISAEKKYEMDKNISKLLYSKIKLVQENLNQNNIKNIEVLIEKSNKQKEQGKLGISLQKAQKALKIVNEMFISNGKDKIIEEIKINIDDIYLIQIEILIEQGNQLKTQKSIDESLQILNNALDLSDKMFSSKEKNKIKYNIKKKIDSLFSDMINIIIENGNRLRKDMEFDNSIIVFKDALKIAIHINNSNIKNSEINKLNNLIYQAQIAKIKNLF